MKTFCNFDFFDDSVLAGVFADATPVSDIVIPVQTHSCNIAVIDKDGSIPSLDDTDAIISLCPGLKIGVRTADCVPVLIYAPDLHAVAAVHSGWKGSLGGIVSHTIEHLHSLGASPAVMKAAFGPSICGQCYQVSQEMIDDFNRQGFADCIIGSRNLDLEAVNRRRLIEAGLSPANIQPKPACTFENATLPSWRRCSTAQRLLTWAQLPNMNKKEKLVR